MVEIQSSPELTWGFWSSHKRIWEIQAISTCMKQAHSFAGNFSHSTWNTVPFPAHKTSIDMARAELHPKNIFIAGMKWKLLRCRVIGAGRQQVSFSATFHCLLSPPPPPFPYFMKYLMVTFPLYFSSFDRRKQKPCLGKYAFCKSALPGRTNR